MKARCVVTTKSSFPPFAKVSRTCISVTSVKCVVLDEQCLSEQQHDLQAKVESLDTRLIGIEEQLKQARQICDEICEIEFAPRSNCTLHILGVTIISEAKGARVRDRNIMYSYNLTLATPMPFVVPSFSAAFLFLSKKGYNIDCLIKYSFSLHH